MRGEDDVDEDGDGGPRLDVGTSAWGEGPTVVGDPSDCENEEGTAVGGESACSDSKFGRTFSGESGGESGGGDGEGEDDGGLGEVHGNDLEKKGQWVVQVGM